MPDMMSALALRPAASALLMMHTVSAAEPSPSTPARRRNKQDLGIDEPALSGVNSKLPSWLRLSGELRFRTETRQGLGYVEGNDDGYGLLRTRLNVDVTPSKSFRVFFQGQDARVPGIRPSRANGVFRDPFEVR